MEISYRSVSIFSILLLISSTESIDYDYYHGNINKDNFDVEQGKEEGVSDGNVLNSSSLNRHHDQKSNKYQVLSNVEDNNEEKCTENNGENNSTNNNNNISNNVRLENVVSCSARVSISSNLTPIRPMPVSILT